MLLLRLCVNLINLCLLLWLHSPLLSRDFLLLNPLVGYLVHKKRQLPRETTISKVLLPLLEQYRSIDIAGIGNLSLKSIDASLDKETHEIFPPMRTLVFSTDLKEQHEFFDILPDALGKKAVKQLRADVDFAINGLINLGRSTIEGVATIERQADGAFSLANIDPSIGGHLQYLPVVQLEPLASPNEGWMKGVGQTVTDQVTPAKTLPPSPYHKKEASSPAWSTYLWPLIGLVAAMALIAFLMKQCGTPSISSKQEPAEKEATTTIAQDSVDRNKQIFENDQLAKYKDILTQEILEAGCSIVVGSFADRDRAISMATQVRSMNYDVDDVGTVKPFRVVIRFDCSEYDLDSYLDEVRSKFDPKAWYLSPSYEPEE